jgi:hypothetical protein
MKKPEVKNLVSDFLYGGKIQQISFANRNFSTLPKAKAFAPFCLEPKSPISLIKKNAVQKLIFVNTKELNTLH